MNALKFFKFSKGQQHMLLAAFLFAVMGAIVKFLDHLPAYELVFFRALVTFICCAFLIWKAKLSPWGNNRRVLVLRGLSGTLGLWLYFYTLQTLPLASATSFHFLAPIFTILISGIFLKEPAPFKQWIFFITAFLGVLMVKGFDPRISSFGLILAIGAAVSSAIAYNFVRVLKKSDEPAVIVFYFSMITLPLMGPYTFTHWVMPQPSDWIWILLVGLATQFAQMNLTKALHLEKAANVTHLNYLSLLYALGFGYLFFGESVPLMALAGMFVIVFSLIFANRLRSL